jgi:hypothetical protein
VAQLSFDGASNTNVISQKLATTVLRNPIRSLGKESIESRAIIQEDRKFQGVDVVWCLANEPKRIYGPTLFLLSTEYDPPYDVVLGKGDALQSGF